MRIRILYLLFFILIFCNCNGQQVEKTEAGNTKEHTFQMVSVPSVITEPEERAAYLVKHYWDKFDFTDTTLIHFPEITEQATSNYIDMMKYVPAKVAASSIKEMMSKASTDSSMFVYFSGLYEKYLYDPNSPMRDESLYIYVLDAVLEAPFLDEVSKIRPAHLLELALKNRVNRLQISRTRWWTVKKELCIVRKLIVYSCFSIIRIAMPVRKLRISSLLRRL